MLDKCSVGVCTQLWHNVSITLHLYQQEKKKRSFSFGNILTFIPVDQMLLNVIPSNLSVRSEAFVTIRVPHCYVYRFFTSIQCTPASYLLGAIVDRDGNWWPYAVRTRLLFWLHRGSGNITLPSNLDSMIQWYLLSLDVWEPQEN